MNKPGWTLSLLLCLPAGPSWAEEASQTRTSIVVISSGKEISRVQFPIGMKGVYTIHANQVDDNEKTGVLRLRGNALIHFTPAGGSAAGLDFIGDELVLSKEVLDAGKLKAVADLEAMDETDQRYRGTQSLDAASWALQTQLDLANLRRLAEIVGQYGWPGARFAGIKGSQSAFLVLQHADLETQQKYLPLFRDAVSKNDAPASELAMLEDRVRVGAGQPQIYGTQVRDGQPVPIEDEANVDRKRAAVGLMPLEEYMKKLGIRYQKNIRRGGAALTHDAHGGGFACGCKQAAGQATTAPNCPCTGSVRSVRSGPASRPLAPG
ncbi:MULTISPECIES: DUF6624 domain-containing protein [unclassified Janthinobacterium]|uniref:DUF6624 domain-containing protein n=1 Tax=unclassified Janthinobacterium TaxID=2610881 RepID=UPI0012F8C13B|nr:MULTISPECIES: DUF6624 domain-containing protein [unclassified Janthinobacterium]